MFNNIIPYEIKIFFSTFFKYSLNKSGINCLIMSFKVKSSFDCLI